MWGRLGNGLASRSRVVVDKTLEECGQGRVELVGEPFLGHHVDRALFLGADGDGDLRGAGPHRSVDAMPGRCRRSPAAFGQVGGGNFASG